MVPSLGCPWAPPEDLGIAGAWAHHTESRVRLDLSFKSVLGKKIGHPRAKE